MRDRFNTFMNREKAKVRDAKKNKAQGSAHEVEELPVDVDLLQ